MSLVNIMGVILLLAGIGVFIVSTIASIKIRGQLIDREDWKAWVAKDRLAAVVMVVLISIGITLLVEF